MRNYKLGLRKKTGEADKLGGEMFFLGLINKKSFSTKNSKEAFCFKTNHQT